jgi:membrane protein
MIQKTKIFLTEDIWRFRRRELPHLKSFGLKIIRIVMFAFKGFNEDRCQLSAAALTFLTLFSIVPVFAMAFGIAKGCGLEKLLVDQLHAQAQGQEEVINLIIGFSERMLESTSGGLIAGIGILILFFTVIRLLGNIELSLNGIWGVIEHRSWVRKFSDYLSIMVVCPVLMILVSSMNVFIVSEITTITEKIELLGMFSSLIFLSLKLLPFVVLWVVFSFVYIVIPNTKVNITAGLIGGVAAGTIYQIFQGLYISLQVGVASYSAVYGSFAALPLFLFWLQTSWLIMLFGAEISFAFQNVDTYELEPDCLKASELFKKLTALRLANLVVKAFVAGTAPVKESILLNQIEIPMRLAKELLYRLVEAGILIEIRHNSSREIAYTPGKDPEIITVGYVIKALDSYGLMDIPIKESEEINKLKQSLLQFQEQLDQSPLNTPLKSI